MIIDPDQANPHQEPCLACGEETAVGSVFCSDRHDVQVKDGRRGYLCSDCVRRIRAAGRAEDLDETDRALVALAGFQLTAPTSH
jgi:hypothetical protein